MPNRWIEFVKKWASEHNTSYGCALTKPEMKEAYHKENPKKVTMPKRVAKLQESRPPADVKSKMTFPNLKIVTQPQQEQENIQFDIEEMDKKAKRGRPQKYVTDEDKYKAKLESNKQKRREKAAAKKIKGSGNNCIGRLCQEQEEEQEEEQPPIPPPDPLMSGIAKLPEGPKNLIKDFLPNKLKTEPERDAQIRAKIEALIPQLQRNPREHPLNTKNRTNKIYYQIIKLLEKITVTTPQEHENLRNVSTPNRGWLVKAYYENLII